ncbi:MAG TPA: FkbM family methyltransferase [Rhodanobacteraceae bacterium]|nr:FkbM family methyltransferase [Rhodanobacteraceae bacterium]
MSDHEVSVQIGNTNHRIVSDDAYLDAVGPVFEPPMVKLFSSLILPRHVVVDVGANIGLTTILFSQLAAKVISFEASPSTFRYLRRNVSQSGSHNVTLVNLGLGNKNVRSEITFAPNNRAGGFVSDQTKASKGHITEIIDIRKLDDLFVEFDAAEKLDFIKLDVEGYEKFVIEGAHKLITCNRPLIVLELNHWCLNAFQRITVPDFFDFLRGRFPIVLAVHDNHFLDLHDSSQSYTAMYRHIVQGQYPNVVCAFDSGQLSRFMTLFKNG